MSESQEERRRHERQKFNAEEDRIEFLVEAHGEFCKIHTVHDVSISGIRLGLAEDLEVGVPVVLTAREEDFSIAVKGEVRWTKASEEFDGHEFGIELSSENVDNNILFFMSLRKYLDTFDDEPVKEI